MGRQEGLMEANGEAMEVRDEYSKPVELGPQRTSEEAANQGLSKTFAKQPVHLEQSVAVEGSIKNGNVEAGKEETPAEASISVPRVTAVKGKASTISTEEEKIEDVSTNGNGDNTAHINTGLAQQSAPINASTVEEDVNNVEEMNNVEDMSTHKVEDVSANKPMEMSAGKAKQAGGALGEDISDREPIALAVPPVSEGLNNDNQVVAPEVRDGQGNEEVGTAKVAEEMKPATTTVETVGAKDERVGGSTKDAEDKGTKMQIEEAAKSGGGDTPGHSPEVNTQSMIKDNVEAETMVKEEDKGLEPKPTLDQAAHAEETYSDGLIPKKDETAEPETVQGEVKDEVDMAEQTAKDAFPAGQDIPKEGANTAGPEAIKDVDTLKKDKIDVEGQESGIVDGEGDKEKEQTAEAKTPPEDGEPDGLDVERNNSKGEQSKNETVEEAKAGNVRVDSPLKHSTTKEDEVQTKDLPVQSSNEEAEQSGAGMQGAIEDKQEQSGESKREPVEEDHGVADVPQDVQARDATTTQPQVDDHSTAQSQTKTEPVVEENGAQTAVDEAQAALPAIKETSMQANAHEPVIGDEQVEEKRRQESITETNHEDDEPTAEKTVEGDLHEPVSENAQLSYAPPEEDPEHHADVKSDATEEAVASDRNNKAIPADKSPSVAESDFHEPAEDKAEGGGDNVEAVQNPEVITMQGANVDESRELSLEDTANEGKQEESGEVKKEPVEEDHELRVAAVPQDVQARDGTTTQPQVDDHSTAQSQTQTEPVVEEESAQTAVGEAHAELPPAKETSMQANAHEPVAVDEQVEEKGRQESITETNRGDDEPASERTIEGEVHEPVGENAQVDSHAPPKREPKHHADIKSGATQPEESDRNNEAPPADKFPSVAEPDFHEPDEDKAEESQGGGDNVEAVQNPELITTQGANVEEPRELSLEDTAKEGKQEESGESKKEPVEEDHELRVAAVPQDVQARDATTTQPQVDDHSTAQSRTQTETESVVEENGAQTAVGEAQAGLPPVKETSMQANAHEPVIGEEKGRPESITETNRQGDEPTTEKPIEGEVHDPVSENAQLDSQAPLEKDPEHHADVKEEAVASDRNNEAPPADKSPSVAEPDFHEPAEEKAEESQGGGDNVEAIRNPEVITTQGENVEEPRELSLEDTAKKGKQEESGESKKEEDHEVADVPQEVQARDGTTKQPHVDDHSTAQSQTQTEQVVEEENAQTAVNEAQAETPPAKETSMQANAHEPVIEQVEEKEHQESISETNHEDDEPTTEKLKEGEVHEPVSENAQQDSQAPPEKDPEHHADVKSNEEQVTEEAVASNRNREAAPADKSQSVAESDFHEPAEEKAGDHAGAVQNPDIITTQGANVEEPRELSLEDTAKEHHEAAHVPEDVQARDVRERQVDGHSTVPSNTRTEPVVEEKGSEMNVVNGDGEAKLELPPAKETSVETNAHEPVAADEQVEEKEHQQRATATNLPEDNEPTTEKTIEGDLDEPVTENAQVDNPTPVETAPEKDPEHHADVERNVAQTEEHGAQETEEAIADKQPETNKEAAEANKSSTRAELDFHEPAEEKAKQSEREGHSIVETDLIDPQVATSSEENKEHSTEPVSESAVEPQVENKEHSAKPVSDSADEPRVENKEHSAEPVSESADEPRVDSHPMAKEDPEQFESNETEEAIADKELDMNTKAIAQQDLDKPAEEKVEEAEQNTDLVSPRVTVPSEAYKAPRVQSHATLVVAPEEDREKQRDAAEEININREHGNDKPLSEDFHEPAEKKAEDSHSGKLNTMETDLEDPQVATPSEENRAAEEHSTEEQLAEVINRDLSEENLVGEAPLHKPEPEQVEEKQADEHAGEQHEPDTHKSEQSKEEVPEVPEGKSSSEPQVQETKNLAGASEAHEEFVDVQTEDGRPIDTEKEYIEEVEEVQPKEEEAKDTSGKHVQAKDNAKETFPTEEEESEKEAEDEIHVEAKETDDAKVISPEELNEERVRNSHAQRDSLSIAERPLQEVEVPNTVREPVESFPTQEPGENISLKETEQTKELPAHVSNEQAENPPMQAENGPEQVDKVEEVPSTMVEQASTQENAENMEADGPKEVSPREASEEQVSTTKEVGVPNLVTENSTRTRTLGEEQAKADNSPQQEMVEHAREEQADADNSLQKEPAEPVKEQAEANSSPQEETAEHAEEQPEVDSSPQKETAEHIEEQPEVDSSPQEETVEHAEEQPEVDSSPQKETAEHVEEQPEVDSSPQKETAEHVEEQQEVDSSPQKETAEHVAKAHGSLQEGKGEHAEEQAKADNSQEETAGNAEEQAKTDGSPQGEVEEQVDAPPAEQAEVKNTQEEKGELAKEINSEEPSKVTNEQDTKVVTNTEPLEPEQIEHSCEQVPETKDTGERPRPTETEVNVEQASELKEPNEPTVVDEQVENIIEEEKETNTAPEANEKQETAENNKVDNAASRIPEQENKESTKLTRAASVIGNVPVALKNMVTAAVSAVEKGRTTKPSKKKRLRMKKELAKAMEQHEQTVM